MRFWIALLVIALANVLGWALFARPSDAPGTLPPPTGLVADQILPERVGEVGPELRLVYDRPLAASAAGLRATIAPPVPGAWRWHDARTLAFVPSAPLAPATAYAIRIPGGIVAADRSRSEPFAVTVRTAPLRLLAAYMADRADDGRTVIALRCSHPVSPTALAAAVSVHHGDGGRIPVAVAGAMIGPEQRLLVGPVSDHDDLTVEVRLPAGFAGSDGPLGLEQEARQRVILTRALRIESADIAADPWSGQGRLTVQCNRPADAQRVREALRCEPPVALTLADAGAGTRIVFHGAFAPGTRYRLIVAPPASAAGGAAAHWPRPDRLEVRSPEIPAVFSFVAGSGWLPGAADRPIAWRAVNLRRVTLRVRRVYANRLGEALHRWQADEASAPALERELRLGAGSAGRSGTVTLAELLGGTVADGAYVLSAEARPEDAVGDQWPQGDRIVVGVGDLALSVRRGAAMAWAWTTRLGDGTVQPGAVVQVRSRKGQVLGEGRTDADGWAAIPLSGADAEDAPDLVVAEHGGALAWLPLRGQGVVDPQAQVLGRAHAHGLEAFVHPDRGLARPGEALHWRALVRGREGAADPGLPVRWRVIRPDGRLWSSATAALDRDGAASLDMQLPASAPTGTWTASVELPGGMDLGAATVAVEAFWPERLAAELSAPGDAGRAPALGASATTCTLALSGRWLWGAPASAAPAVLSLALRPVPWQHAGWAGWVAGDAAEAGAVLAMPSRGEAEHHQQRTELDARGEATWTAPLVLAGSGPWQAVATASIAEAGGRSVSARSVFPVDPREVRLLVRCPPPTALQPQAVELALVTPAGRAFAATRPIAVQATRHRDRWEEVVQRRDGRYRIASERRIDPEPEAAAQVVIPIGATGARIVLPGGPAGAVVIRVADDAGIGPTSVAAMLASADGGWTGTVARDRPQRVVLRLVDGAAAPVAPGATVAVDVLSPFAGTLLLTIDGREVIERRVAALAGTATRVVLVADPRWGSQVHLTATVIRGRSASAAGIARAHGVLALRSTPEDRLARVAITAPERIAPGSELRAVVRVSAADGHPLADAGVTVAMVDEGALRPVAFRTPDPFAWLHGARAHGIRLWDVYAHLLPDLVAGVSAVGGDGGSGDDAMPLTSGRVEVARWWSGVRRTDADGQVALAWTPPAGFAGRLRLMAVAVDGRRCGAGEAGVAVSGPLLTQLSVPRVLAPGDRWRIPVTLIADRAGASQAVVRVMGSGLRVAAEAATVALPVQGQAVAWFPAEATAEDGTVATASAAATAGAHAHAQASAILVRSGRPRRLVGGSFLLGSGTPAALAPAGVLPGGELSLRVADLPDPGVGLAVDQLLAYPHGCAEQTAARALAVVRLAELDPSLRMACALRLDDAFARLALMTTADGGVAMWPGQASMWPWATAFALLVAGEAEAAGFAVPDALRSHLIGGAERILLGSASDERRVRAFAAQALATVGRIAPARLHHLADQAGSDEDAVDVRLHLALAWAAFGDRERGRRLLAPLAPAPARLERSGDLRSPSMRTALDLLARIRCGDAGGDALGVVAALGRSEAWTSTHDAAWTALALGAWRAAMPRLGWRTVRVRAADGRLIASGTAPLFAWRGRAEPGGVVLELDGAPGAAGAHASWTASGLDAGIEAPPVTGLRLRRSWSATSAVRVGELLTVSLEVDADEPIAHVVIDDPLPGAVEVEHPRLLTTAAERTGGTLPRADRPDRIEYRDDRVVAVGDVRPGRPLRLSYQVRVVAAGEFAIPPATAEAMYDRRLQALAPGGRMLAAPR